MLLTAWTQARCSPPEDLGGAVPAFETTTAAATSKRPLVYLRNGGGTYNRGPKWRRHDDSRKNRSKSLLVGQATLAPANMGAAWSEVVACVKDNYKNIAVDFTETDPGSRRHIEIAVTSDGAEKAGEQSDVGGFATAAYGKIAYNGVGFVFTKYMNNSVTQICEAASHEIGHALGLDHELYEADIMGYGPHTERKVFIDFNVTCGEYASRDCKYKNPVTGNKSTQNSYQYLVRKVGTQTPAGSFGGGGSRAALVEPGSDVERGTNGAARAGGSCGFWTVGDNGTVSAFGSAGLFGDASNVDLNMPITGMASHPNGGGYWLVAEDGGVFTFGNAGFYGSAAVSGARIITAIARAPNGRGYWLAGADGSVYAFGEAAYFGGTSGRELTDPVEGIAATADGGGYWLLTAYGASIAYGNAGTQCVTPTPCGTLPPGKSLYPGQSVTSCNGRNRLTLNGDGNLVLYRDGAALWASNTAGTGSNVAVMQGDGNFVVYAPWGATWATGTRLAGSRLEVQDDANMVIFSGGWPVWTSDTCGLMVGGQSLGVGQSLTSCDGRFTLVMQGDGNLVLYKKNVGHLWASWTQGTGSNVMYVQGDGNMVIYSPWRATWSSGTPGRSNPRLKAQNDGNLVLYSNGVPVWSSGTPGH
ncbi:MAG TPA: hypothetical protein VK420_19090 [Longimicrobium sp.]|nr:hypothetical protein [Longimicrobium sp.]